jgi:hypothetical protein
MGRPRTAIVRRHGVTAAVVKMPSSRIGVIEPKVGDYTRTPGCRTGIDIVMDAVTVIVRVVISVRVVVVVDRGGSRLVPRFQERTPPGLGPHAQQAAVTCDRRPSKTRD